MKGYEEVELVLVQVESAIRAGLVLVGEITDITEKDETDG